MQLQRKRTGYALVMNQTQVGGNSTTQRHQPRRAGRHDRFQPGILVRREPPQFPGNRAHCDLARNVLLNRQTRIADLFGSSLRKRRRPEHYFHRALGQRPECAHIRFQARRGIDSDFSKVLKIATWIIPLLLPAGQRERRGDPRAADSCSGAAGTDKHGVGQPGTGPARQFRRSASRHVQHPRPRNRR